MCLCDRFLKFNFFSQSGMICFRCIQYMQWPQTKDLAAMAQEHLHQTIDAATVGVYEYKFR